MSDVEVLVGDRGLICVLVIVCLTCQCRRLTSVKEHGMLAKMMRLWQCPPRLRVLGASCNQFHCTTTYILLQEAEVFRAPFTIRNLTKIHFFSWARITICFMESSWHARYPGNVEHHEYTSRQRPARKSLVKRKRSGRASQARREI